MTNVAPNKAIVTPATAAETKQIVLKDIGAKWDKFSEQDLSRSRARTIWWPRSWPSTASKRLRLSATSTRS